MIQSAPLSPQGVVVVIPIYKPQLDASEILSVCRTCQILGRYPIVVVHPEGMDTGAISARWTLLQFKSFPERYFDGIMGYNRFMLSPEFYGAFLEYEYLLICQTDVYVFRDDLPKWCDAGYDYVGAPWLRRPVYDMPVIRQMMSISLQWTHLRGRRSRQDLFGRVGNGGFSLRRVKSHYEVTVNMRQTIERYTCREKKYHLYNEDVFWAMEPKNFKYPAPEQALAFSFDKYPDICLSRTGGVLPMGCHGWSSRRMKKFWTKYIDNVRTA